MKNIKLLFLFSFVVLFFTQCKKDEITTDPPVIITLDDQTQVNFLIQITDVNHQAIEGANLILNTDGSSYSTDENGLLFLNNQRVKNYGIPVTIQKDGYLDQIAVIKGISNSNNVVRLKLLKAEKTTLIAQGGTGELSGGGSLTLPTGIVTANNQPYAGDVVVESFYFNPDQANFMQNAPGELLAFDADNELRALGSFGMYAIELKDQSGNELKLGNGSKAEIEFPIASSQSGTIPQTIPLWSLNEATGVWESEGTAQREGNQVVAEVSHFSFWNIDIQFTPIRVCMTLVDQNNTALPYTSYLISSTDLSVNYDYGTTDANGQVCTFVPQEEALAIQMIDGANSISDAAVIAAINSEADLGNVVMPVTAYHFTGRALDCNNNPVVNALVRHSQNGLINHVYSDAVGVFQFSSWSDQDQLVKLFDLSGNLKSDEIVASTNGSANIDLGDISLCTNIQSGEVITINADITSDMTWLEGNTYILEGIVSVTNNATLNIEPGVVVKGLTDTNNEHGALVITQGAKINALGTSQKPIIFTSFFDEIEPGAITSPNLTESDNGLWAGVYILGNAPISTFTGSTVNLAFLPAASQFEYGGSDVADNSGTLRYVSIRHSGSELVPQEESNGLTLAGVGNGTTIEHIELYAVLDDGLELLGGSVDISNAIVWEVWDDGYDVVNGWSGTLDNFIYIAGNNADQTLELDGGTGANNPSFTMINGSCKGKDGDYILFRKNVNCKIENSYFFNYAETSEVEFRDDEVASNWINSLIDVANLEFNTSHLSGGNQTINSIFVDKGLNNQDAITVRPPNAIISATPSVGANKTVFSNWSLADQTGALTDF